MNHETHCNHQSSQGKNRRVRGYSGAESTVWTCSQVGEGESASASVSVSASWAATERPLCVLSRPAPALLPWPARPWCPRTCRQTQRRRSRKTAWWCHRTPTRRWPRRAAGRSSPDRRRRRLVGETVKENSVAVQRRVKAWPHWGASTNSLLTKQGTQKYGTSILPNTNLKHCHLISVWRNQPAFLTAGY